MRPLTGLRNLRSLDLSATRITDIAPLASLTTLQFLDLTGTSVTDLAPLSKLTNLRWLNMRNTHADVSPLSRLAGCHVITTTQTPPRREHR
jgi:internalin A